MKLLACIVAQSEARFGLGPRRIGGATFVDELLSAQRDVQADLFVHLDGGGLVAPDGEPEEASDAGSDLGWPHQRFLTPDRRLG